MLDRSRIQGFGSDSIEGSKNIGKEADRPWQPLQDISDLANDIKSFVTSRVGMEQTGKDEDEDDDDNVVGRCSPRQRCEALSIISKFGQSYKHARVAPTAEELANIWLKCCVLQPEAVASVIYDTLSFSSGDFEEWQPRLRILYFIEVLYWKGGRSKEIALTIKSHAGEILKHLATEVPQTKMKAKEVLDTLAGLVPEAPEIVKAVDSVEAKPAAPTQNATPDAKPEQGVVQVAPLKSALKAQPAKAAPTPAAAAPPQARPKEAPKVAAPPQDLLDFSASSD